VVSMFLTIIHILIVDEQPRNAISPGAISPSGNDLEENPFEAEFDGDDDYDSEDIDDGLDFTPPSDPSINNFAVLNSSLPLPDQQPEHYLAPYLNAKRSAGGRDKTQHRTKWHFGIRSQRPPMEVMLEIYRSLKTLGMEWKEKRNLGGLGGVRPGVSGAGIERRSELDGGGGVDLKAASSIYFVETRARVRDVVVSFSTRTLCADTKLRLQVLMNLQLYTVDSISYLVDFHHKKTYRASTEPGAGKFDMAVFDPTFSETSSESGKSVMKAERLKECGEESVKEDEVVSPFVFMDVACRLIQELAGGGQ